VYWNIPGDGILRAKYPYRLDFLVLEWFVLEHSYGLNILCWNIPTG
jgi:hypothetical protein